jgi:hypothetical protein
MATTTNYGWTTPDDTDLVKDGAAAIRTLGSSVDTTTKALNPETTTGDIAYRSATANTNTRLALGTAGQVLTVNSGATAPEWADAAGGGKVLQVVQATYSTEVTNATSTYADTGLTATITPSSATSKVLVMVSQQGCSKTSANADNSIELKLLRGATDILQFVTFGILTNSALRVNGLNYSANYLDTPATTSATTYKTQFRNQNGTAAVQVQAISSAVSTILLLEIGA